MATLSSLGISGSGLDASVVTKLMAIEQQPLKLLQTKATGIQTQISSYAQIKSGLSSLYEAANGLMNTDTWKSKLFTSSDASVVDGSATAAAAGGSISVKVNALAQAQSLATASFTSNTAVGAAGRLTLEMGTWNDDGTAFTTSGSPLNVDIAATDTLSDIAAKINNSGASVSAMVVKGTSGDQLVLRGTTTGAANGFSLSATNSDGSALASGSALQKLAYDPASIASGQSTITRSAKAQDASFSIDGIEATSATNTVTDVISGVSLTLKKISDTPVNIELKTDTDTIKAKIEAFQKAYNSLNSVLANLTKYDSTTKTAQPLQGDSTAVGLQNAMRSLLGRSEATGSRFSDIGLEIQKDGSLSINETKLKAAMSDLPKLNKVLTADADGDANDGLVTRIRDFAFAANSTSGNLTGRTQSLQDALTRNGKDQDAFNVRLAQKQARLEAQYSRLDTKMASLSTLSSFISQQTTKWNNS